MDNQFYLEWLSQIIMYQGNKIIDPHSREEEIRVILDVEDT